MSRRRALLSLYDKRGLEPFARGLVEHGFELVASGGTARALRQAGQAVLPVETLTGYPEMLGGRVKTLHPAIHGGILARRSPEHLAELAERGIAPIDLVACNLYPFAETVSRAAVTEAEAVEEIDIGGVTLLRAAAKNHVAVIAVCDPDDYAEVLAGLECEEFPPASRRYFALKAFRHTAAYDAAIAVWLEGLGPPAPAEALPPSLLLAAERVQMLRYGENPHQQAALYQMTGEPPAFAALQGKELSYNNLVDLDAAWALAAEFDRPAVAIVKHTNPCGLALAGRLADAWQPALEGDPVSAYGSVVAVNRPVDLEFVDAIGSLFIEVLAAPDFAPDALERLAVRKKNCRAVRVAAARDRPGRLRLRSLAGGLLAQTDDTAGADPTAWRLATRRAPTDDERAALAFAWLAVKHVKSNAIVLARGPALVGVGAGQASRIDSVRIAAEKAGERARGSVLASDAFFPFADGLELAARAGVTAVIQPGGSVRDAEVIAAADERGVAMLITGERHFRH